MEMSLKDINVYLKTHTESAVLKTLYICNLEWKTTIEELKDFFAPYGSVTTIDIKKDKKTGKPMGYGFITMENADLAMLSLNGKEFRGRALKINNAREREIPTRRIYKARPTKKRA